ncbi:hypothetical protein BD309DRAFT_864331 [Dichomitus squalens]|uniref:Uncharacterized protein n=1 Tax=Dichomitus squalens TaxID=114155 RepID=A0A4Q9NQH1_9APHY|nr:hypothetical protein BD311DRAFT_358038 [Dichomitus squalens]TBU43428.1 hypothetical protein BD309DRAFT_864331 [Dichomitus squalens]TBU60837.1 hypothetical protein BD310DRAFT_814443 [Dichomitus squalens]
MEVANIAKSTDREVTMRQPCKSGNYRTCGNAFTSAEARTLTDNENMATKSSI